jgi:23S rRNA (uracil1939-C5)-methyltransferase
LPNHGIEFKFRPAMFTQVNYEINRQMIDRVIETLDLYWHFRVLRILNIDFSDCLR